MSSIEQQAKGKKDGEIRYLTPLISIQPKTKKYCRFQKSGIKYVDYKDADWLLGFVNEQGKIITKTFNRNIFKVSKKSVCSCKKSASLSIDALRSRFIKIK